MTVAGLSLWVGVQSACIIILAWQLMRTQKHVTELAGLLGEVCEREFQRAVERSGKLR